MAITPSTLVQLEIKNALVKAKVGAGVAVEFGDHVDSIALTTTSATSTFKAVSGKNQSKVQDPEETLVLNLGQSLKADSLWMFLRTNHGKTGTIEFYPAGGTTPKVEADVTFQAPGTLGGVQGAASSGATILVNGLAVITPAAA